jgi:hypothetical protein
MTVNGLHECNRSWRAFSPQCRSCCAALEASTTRSFSQKYEEIIDAGECSDLNNSSSVKAGHSAMRTQNVPV